MCMERIVDEITVGDSITIRQLIGSDTLSDRVVTITVQLDVLRSS